MASIDLSGWSLKLPPAFKQEMTQNSDGRSLDRLRSKFFRTEDDGSLTFIAPAGGSYLKRCAGTEIRKWHASNAQLGWNTSQEGYLSASVRVNEAPVDPEGAAAALTISEIFCGRDVFCSLQFQGGRLYLVDRHAHDSKTFTRTELCSFSGQSLNVPMSARFDYFLRVQMSSLTVSVIFGGKTYSATRDVPASWVGKRFHFSVGAKLQNDLENPLTGNGNVSYLLVSEPKAPAGSEKAEDAEPIAKKDKKVVKASILLEYEDGERVEIPMTDF